MADPRTHNLNHHVQRREPGNHDFGYGMRVPGKQQPRLIARIIGRFHLNADDGNVEPSRIQQPLRLLRRRGFNDSTALVLKQRDTYLAESCIRISDDYPHIPHDVCPWLTVPKHVIQINR